MRCKSAASCGWVTGIGGLYIAVQFVRMAAGRFDLNRHVANAEFSRNEAADRPEDWFVRHVLVDQYMAG